VTDPADWIENKFLASVEPSDVTWVERISDAPDSSWRLTRSEKTELINGVEQSTWSLPSGQVPNWAAEQLLAVLTDLRASDVVEAVETSRPVATRYGLGVDVFRAGIGGAVFQFQLGASASDGHRYIYIEGLPWVYTVAEYEAESLRQVDLSFFVESRQEE